MNARTVATSSVMIDATLLRLAKGRVWQYLANKALHFGILILASRAFGWGIWFWGLVMLLLAFEF